MEEYIRDVLATVDSCNSKLEFIREEEWTYDLAKALVFEFPEALNSVPEDLKTTELLMIAGKSCVSGATLMKQPSHLFTEEVYLASLRHPVACWKCGYHQGITLKEIPEQERTYDICLKAVGLRGAWYFWVPAKHQTYEVCLAALKKDKGVWECLPIRHKTYKMQKDANCWF